MKWLLVLLLILGFISPATAARIAVLDLKPVGADPILAQAVSENLRTMIIQGGRYEVVERAQLTSIIAEYSLEQSGLTEEGHARAIGTLAQVDFVLLGSLSQIFETYTINVRIIDVTSGVIQEALKTDMGSHAEFPRKIDELAFNIGSDSSLTDSAPPTIAGTFRTEGDDYIGQLSIRQAGDLYLLTWQIDNSQTGAPPQIFIGTGILNGNVLSAYYHSNAEPDNFGIAAYEILLGGTQLRGLYTNLGTAAAYNKVRFENATRQD